MKYNQKQINDRTSDYVCFDCGKEFLSEEQKNRNFIITVHESHCGLCNELKSVVHIRNWNYLKLKN